MQQPISVLIIEDEPIWSKTIAINLLDFGFTIAGTADTFEIAVSALSSLKYDIVLLDINLHGANTGIELGKMANSLYHKPFIFVTASMDQHTLLEAVEARPSAYLTKPVNPVSLFVTIQNAINNFSNAEVAAIAKEPNSNTEWFFVKVGDKYKKINWKDVVYLSSEKNYTAVFNAADKTEYFIRSTMPKTLKYLVPSNLQKQFVQVNRSEMVQLSFVQELASEEVRTDFKTFTLTDSYSKELKNKINIIA